MIRSRAYRTRTSLPVSMMLPAPIAGEFLGGAARDDLVEQGLFVAVFAEESAQPLYVLADAAGPREDNAHVGRRNVHALVQHLAGHHHRVFAGMKAEQNLPALLGLALVRDRRH